MCPKSFWRLKKHLRSFMIKNNQFYPKKDNFMIEFGVQHIEIKYLHLKRFVFCKKHLTGAFYVLKMYSMPKK